MIVHSKPTPQADSTRPSWICRLFGHSVRTVQFDEIASWMPGWGWCWPGVITYCRRCDLIFRHAGNERPQCPSWGQLDAKGPQPSTPPVDQGHLKS